MRQSEIKADRFYRSQRSGGVRFVTNITIIPATKVWYVEWRRSGTNNEIQTLRKSFAKWADEEVAPLFHGVRRCIDCEEFYGKDELPAKDVLCEKCGGLVQSEHDY